MGLVVAIWSKVPSCTVIVDVEFVVGIVVEVVLVVLLEKYI